MSTESFIITKRDGHCESFSLEKIKSAIIKACAAVGDNLNAEDLQRVVSHLRFCNGMSVEDIQNQVEVALMTEAKAFIVCRNRRAEERETSERLRFLVDHLNKKPKSAINYARKKLRNAVSLFSGIAGIDAPLDKLLTENTTSENKKAIQHVFEEVDDTTSPEEIINEINEIVETRNIDNRIYNGREAENEICEFIDNDTLWERLAKLYRKISHGLDIGPTRLLLRMLKAAIVAVYQGLPELCCWGKASFVYRLAESKLGQSLGFGVRALQKGVQRFIGFLQHGAEQFIGEVWREKQEANIESFRTLVEMIKVEVFGFKPALVQVN